jgi:hypothetical protein
MGPSSVSAWHMMPPIALAQLRLPLGFVPPQGHGSACTLLLGLGVCKRFGGAITPSHRLTWLEDVISLLTT